jgi:nicotinamidase-related amidase
VNGAIGASERNAWHVRGGVVDLTRTERQPQPVTVPARFQPIALDLARTACIVVDMQNDFCTDGGWLSSIGVDVAPTRSPVAPLAALLPTLRRAGVPVIWLNWGNRPDRANLPPGVLHVYDPDGASVGIGDPLPDSGSHVLERGSWSAAVIDELKIEPGDLSVDKYRMSGFWDTELQSMLVNLDVRTLLFCGVNVDQCVYATLIDAACIGYDCVLLEDCSATTSPPACTEATLYNVAQCFGFVATGADLCTAIEAATVGEAE